MTPCPHPVVTLCPCSDSVSTHQDQDLYQDPDLRPEQIAKGEAVIGVAGLRREEEPGTHVGPLPSSVAPSIENSDGTASEEPWAIGQNPTAPSVFDVVDEWVCAAMAAPTLSSHPVSGKWLRLKDAAFIAKVSPETVANWCKRHGIGRQLHSKAPWKVDPVGLAIVISGNANALHQYRVRVSPGDYALIISPAQTAQPNCAVDQDINRQCPDG